jgi:hypothetical protein
MKRMDDVRIVAVDIDIAIAFSNIVLSWNSGITGRRMHTRVIVSSTLQFLRHRSLLVGPALG